MTQEEKAKAYDEAIKVANKYKDTHIMFHQIKDEIFPELSESEDEKIKKELIEFLKEEEAKADITSKRSKTLCKYIAWLEKQGEQKLCVNDNAKEMFIKALERVEEQNNKGYKLTDCDKNSWWEDFKAYTSCTIVQKPANKIESGKKFTPIESALKDLICDVDNSYTIEQVRRFLFEYGYKDKILNAAQEEMQKPAEWSEEDEKIALSIEQVMNCASLLNMVPEKENKIRTWLKSLKDRVQPQHKEWGEDDKNNILFLTSVIEECFKDKEKITLYGDTACADFTKENVIDRLKSLRPQPQWKPSDEQITALETTLYSNMSRNDERYSVLSEFVAELKKLREE